MTSLFLITFTVGQKNKPKHQKQAQKAGTSIEDAFSKLRVHYEVRDHSKPLVLIDHKLLETYPEPAPWTDADRANAQAYLDECEVLRQRALLTEDYAGLPGAELL